jgi:hypothetical protein
VDWLGTRPDVDMSKLALVGESFGGILAPRVAMKEHRFAAILAIDGNYNARQSFFDEAQGPLIQLYNSTNATAFDAVMNSIRLNSSYPATIRWVVDQGLWSFDTESPYDWLTQIGQINLTQTNVKDIKTPVFVGSGQNDTGFPGQAPVAAEWLGDLAYFYNFTDDLGAGQHCQIGAEGLLSTISLNWLTDIFSDAKKLPNGTIIGSS